MLLISCSGTARRSNMKSRFESKNKDNQKQPQNDDQLEQKYTSNSIEASSFDITVEVDKLKYFIHVSPTTSIEDLMTEA